MNNSKFNIPIAKTEFTESEFEVILEPLKSGWVVQGEFVKQFELKWSEFTSCRNSIAVSNCTNALHLSLAAIGIGLNDEVIVPSFTWVATANAVEYLGAKPVFCDINLSTYNIDCSKIESLISNKTKAIIPVHLFGLSADMDCISDIASKYNLHIIEDAACGFGSYYNNIHTGNFGTTGCFSFHPRKAITTGEGGMITTNDDNLAEKIRAMRDHGAEISDYQRHFGPKPYLLPQFRYLGFNYRLTDIQASIGVSQLNRAEEILSKRISLAKTYDEFFNNIPFIKPTIFGSNFKHGYQSYVCLFEPEEISSSNLIKINEMRNNFMAYLHSNGISTRPGTHAIHCLDYYKNKYGYSIFDYPNSLISSLCSVAFPLFPSLKEQEIQYIFEVINNYKL